MPLVFVSQLCIINVMKKCAELPTCHWLLPQGFLKAVRSFGLKDAFPGMMQCQLLHTA
jgi:hypothetical protein